MMLRLLLVTSIVAAVASPSKAQTDTTNVEAAIRAKLETVLMDAGSADLRLESVPKQGTADVGYKKYTGWLVCAKLNAKNAYGAYVGLRDYLLVLDPSTGQLTALERFDRYRANAEAWRQACEPQPAWPPTVPRS